MCESLNSLPKIATTVASVHLPQVCFLNGHLRKANAENVTLKNQNQIERDAYDKRAAQLQQAMDMHSKCTQEALKAQKAMDARARDTIATSAQHVAAATREQKQAEKMAYDLKLENRKQAETLTAQLDQAQQQLTVLKQQNEALRLCFAALAREVLGGSKATSATIQHDSLEAISQGQEPLERSPKRWLGLVFSLDRAASLQVAPIATGLAPPGRPYHNDGARAVLAMLAAIQRLHARAKAAAKQLQAASGDSPIRK